MNGHSNDVWSVAFSPDGTQVASGSDDDTVKIWSVATGACVSTVAVDVRRLQFSLSGRWLCALSGVGELLVAEASTGRVLFTRRIDPKNFDREVQAAAETATCLFVELSRENCRKVVAELKAQLKQARGMIHALTTRLEQEEERVRGVGGRSRRGARAADVAAGAPRCC
jgi:hypothetical protein